MYFFLNQLKTSFAILLTLLISFASPAHALQIGSSSAEQEQQKYENLFKENTKIKKAVSLAPRQPPHQQKLKLTPEIVKEINQMELSEKKQQERTRYFGQRLDGELLIPLNYDHLPTREKEIAKAIRNIVMAGLAIYAALATAPTKYTNWPDDNKKLSELIDNYEDNVTSGPVWDKDHWGYNLVGHPLSGAYEYLFLRNKGFSKIESFGFAVFASTVLWEYGIEAVVEVPSIQDLILTPTIGAMLGEVFHVWDLKLKDDDYNLAGSRKLGRIVHHIINPVEGINNSIDRLFGVKFLRLDAANLYLRNENQKFNETHENDAYYDDKLTFGLKFVFSMQ